MLNDGGRGFVAPIVKPRIKLTRKPINKLLGDDGNLRQLVVPQISNLFLQALAAKVRWSAIEYHGQQLTQAIGALLLINEGEQFRVWPVQEYIERVGRLGVRRLSLIPRPWPQTARSAPSHRRG